MTTPAPSEVASRPGPRLGPADAAIFETFVVPRYLSLFGELALESVVESEGAQLVHLGCRTGYPDRGLAMKLQGAAVFGVDESHAAIELAGAKAATMPNMMYNYRVGDAYPAPLPDAAFSHALSIHPLAAPNSRALLIAEMHRLLAPSGQMVLALPMRGSFLEVADILRECGLKTDDSALTAAVDRAMARRPTVEALASEIEEAGFEYVDVSLRPATITFPSGRAFAEDPITRLLLLPEFRINLEMEDLSGPMDYVRDAIDKYWSESEFELTVNVGCATGRR